VGPYDENEAITAAAIARLAGVGRAAVSNWRRRYPEFPRPVGGSPTSPTFSRADVEAWLKATGKADQLATAGRTETGTQRVTQPTGSAGDSFDASVQGIQPETPERAVADLTAGQLLARAMVSLLPRSIADARADDDAQAPVVIDPACFQGTVLLAVADRFGDRVRLAGQEIREPAAAVAALNLRGHAHGVPYEIHVGDSLTDDQLSTYLGAAAAVVCEPPLDLPQWPSAELTTDPRWQFGIPAPRDSELAWVQHCYAHLRPRGVAIVAVSPRTCVQASGQHIRAALVRSGALRDVIALPKRMSSLPDTDAYLWVLQRPSHDGDHGTVRLVDLSGLGDAADVPHEFAVWERMLDGNDPTISRAVPRLELLDGETNLLPSRYVTASPAASADDLAGVTRRLQSLYARIGQGLPRFAAAPAAARHSYVTFAELERVGALTIRSRDATPLSGDVLVRTLGRPPMVATGADAEDAGIAQVVEIDDARLDAHFVAAFLRVDAAAHPVANTLGALSRDDLRRCRIPRMPLAEQRQYGSAFRCLAELRDALAALAKVSATVIDQTLHGLTAGVLAPGAPWLHDTNETDATEREMREP
jgi:predicted DNA-binding transcriptional regulator AlpA